MLIEIKNLSKTYVNDEVETPVLHNLSFALQEGEFVAIMGPSGSGKSTLMNVLGFLDTPSQGEYHFKGEEISTFNDITLARLRNKEVGFVFQSFNLLPKTSVRDNVMLPLTYTPHMNAAQKEKRVRDAIEAVGLLPRIDNLSNQLSGGEKQRVAIARALVTQPSIIFADEPTGNLDSKSGGQIMEILNQLNMQGKTIILVTHEQYTAEYAKRILKLADGKLVSDEKVTHRHSAGLVK